MYVQLRPKGKTLKVKLASFSRVQAVIPCVRKQQQQTNKGWVYQALPGLLKLHYMLQLIHDGLLHYHFIQTCIGDHATVKVFHSQPTPELQVGSLQEVLLAHLWVLSIAGHGYGESRQYGVLYEASGQLETKGQLSLNQNYT